MGGGKRSDGGKFCERRRVHGAVGGARKHHVDLARLEQATGVQHSGHGRRTSGIHGVIWPLQVQEIGDPAGDHVGKFARHRVLVHPRRAFQKSLGERIVGLGR